MVINAKISICINFCTSKQLSAIIVALKPEVNSPVTHRANVDLQMHECSLLLTVDAEDTVALRAAVNAYLRWIASTANIVKVIDRM